MQCEDEDCPNPNAEPLHLAPGESDIPRFLCYPCCRRLGLICVKHDVIHMSFRSGGHACLPCIEEATQNLAHEAKSIYDDIQIALPPRELQALEDYAELVSDLTGDTRKDVAVLRAVMTSAARRGLSYRLIINEIVLAKSAKSILPSYV